MTVFPYFPWTFIFICFVKWQFILLIFSFEFSRKFWDFKIQESFELCLIFFLICPLCSCFINGIFKYMEILFHIDQLFYITIPGLISFSESLLHSMIINNHPDIILLYLLSLNVKIIESSRPYMWYKEFLPYFPSKLVTSHPIIIVIISGSII